MLTTIMSLENFQLEVIEILLKGCNKMGNYAKKVSFPIFICFVVVISYGILLLKFKLAYYKIPSELTCLCSFLLLWWLISSCELSNTWVMVFSVHLVLGGIFYWFQLNSVKYFTIVCLLIINMTEMTLAFLFFSVQENGPRIWPPNPDQCWEFPPEKWCLRCYPCMPGQ